MNIGWSEIVLFATGVLGIVNFISDYRAKKTNWWKYLLLVISILMIGEVILWILAPELLHRVFV